MAKTAGVIFTSAFVLSGAEAYEDYISYMDRSEAKRNENFDKYNLYSEKNSSASFNAYEDGTEERFEDYNDYMNNPLKTTAMFNETYSKMTPEKLLETKQYFAQAQTNQSPLWQMVFSFKNEWLLEHGYMSKEQHSVDESALINATRQAMEELEKREGLQGKWTGAIHYNTKHIHVHVGYVEKTPTRDWIFYEHPTDDTKTGYQFKGKFGKKSLRGTRRLFVSSLLKNEEMLASLEKNVQEQINRAKKNRADFLSKRYEQQLVRLYEKLPKRMSMWKYGFAHRNGFKKELDKMINMYLTTDGKDLMDTYIPALKKISDEYESTYGNPNNAPTYFANQLYGKNGLYAKIGNQLLSELVSYEKAKRKKLAAADLGKEYLEQLAEEQEIVPINEEQFQTPEEFENFTNLIAPDTSNFDSLILAEAPENEVFEEEMIPEEFEKLYPYNPTELDLNLSPDNKQRAEEINQLQNDFASLEETFPEFERRDATEMDSLELETLYETNPLIEKANKKMEDYFLSNKKTNQQRLEELAAYESGHTKGLKETRGIYINKIDGETNDYEYISKVTHKKLGKDIILQHREALDFKRVMKETQAHTNKFTNSSERVQDSENRRIIPTSNLESLSKNNKEKVLQQNEGATVVFGSAQWRALGRKVILSEEPYPIMILKPIFEPDSTKIREFIEVPVYDISQTDVLSKEEQREMERNLNRTPSRPRSKQETKALSWWLVLKNRKGLQEYLNKSAYRQLQNELEKSILD